MAGSTERLCTHGVHNSGLISFECTCGFEGQTVLLISLPDNPPLP